MQEQIKELVDRWHDKYPNFWYYREGPCHYKAKFDVLLKNEKEWLYIKAFTNDEYWRIFYKKELSRIQIFNKFCVDQNLSFSWPEIVEYDDDWLFFVMKDIEFNWKGLIDFRNLEKEVAIEHFCKYREVFDKFEKYCVESWYRLDDISGGYSLEFLIDKCKEWYFQWEKAVKECGILIPFYAIESKIIQLYNNYWKSSLPKEMSFKWFWTWHVFEWNGSYQLVDFDIIWYEIKWKSICRFANYCVMLSVDNYVEYEKRKLDFERWKNKMIEMNEKSLVDLLVLTSIVWILYADYGGNMTTQDYNRKLMNGKWVTPEENAKKWMQRCAKLLEEWYWIK